MTSRTSTTRSFETEKIAEAAANLARVMGYDVKTEEKKGTWYVTVTWTPEVDRRFKERFQ
jgi:hypothetical protein